MRDRGVCLHKHTHEGSVTIIVWNLSHLLSGCSSRSSICHFSASRPGSLLHTLLVLVLPGERRLVQVFFCTGSRHWWARVSSPHRKLQYLAVGKCVAMVTSQCPVSYAAETLEGEWLCYLSLMVMFTRLFLLPVEGRQRVNTIALTLYSNRPRLIFFIYNQNRTQLSMNCNNCHSIGTQHDALLDNSGLRWKYPCLQLLDTVSTADVFFNDMMLGWFEKKCYLIASITTAASFACEPPTGALHGILPGVQSQEQATINHWLRTFTSHFTSLFLSQRDCQLEYLLILPPGKPFVSHQVSWVKFTISNFSILRSKISRSICCLSASYIH